MGTQQFSFKWNNHQANMLTFFKHLLSNEAFVDVTLACEGLTLKAHKMVLASCSPFFQNLFLDNASNHPIVILNGIKYLDLKVLIDFMYKGEINIPQEQITSFLNAAETLKVIGLAEATNENVLASQEVQNKCPKYSSVNVTKRSSSPLLTRRILKKSKKKVVTDYGCSDSEDQCHYRELESYGSFKSKFDSPSTNNELSGNESDHNTNNTDSHQVVNNLSILPKMGTLHLKENASKHCDIEPAKLMEQTMKIEEATYSDISLPIELSNKSSIIQSTGSPSKSGQNDHILVSDPLGSFEPLIQNIEPDQNIKTSSTLTLHKEAIVNKHKAESAKSSPSGNECTLMPAFEGPSAYNIEKQSSNLVSEDEDGAYVCSICTKHFPKLNNLKWHYHRAHSTKQYPCPVCNKSFKTRDLMNQHTRVHWPDSFSCSDCGETFRWRSSLKAHRNKCHSL